MCVCKRTNTLEIIFPDKMLIMVHAKYLTQQSDSPVL